MRMLNLFADADGESHFREIDIECADETPWGLKLSKRLPAAAILFVEGGWPKAPSPAGHASGTLTASHFASAALTSISGRHDRSSTNRS